MYRERENLFFILFLKIFLIENSTSIDKESTHNDYYLQIIFLKAFIDTTNSTSKTL